MAIVLDCETTGLNPYKDRVVEVALISWEDPDSLSKLWLFNPMMPIPEEASQIHGITDAHVADAPTFDHHAEELAQIISRADVIIGHNPFFDRTMINAEFRRLNILVSFPPLVCTKRVWDIHEPKEERHLRNAYKRFVNPDGFEDAHSAMADILATRAVLIAQINEFKLHQVALKDIDPDAKLFWGPSNHIVWGDGILVLNFGKHKGVPIHQVEPSYFRWIAANDFPEHLKVLADYIHVYKPIRNDPTGAALASWAYGQGL